MSTIIPFDQPAPPPLSPRRVAALMHVDYDAPQPPMDLLEEDGIPLETYWHRLEMNLLIDCVTQLMGDRRDYCCGGNMFVYFNHEQARNLDYRGPDFFFVDKVDFHKRRPYWAVWEEEGRLPDLIIELASPSTVKIDRTIKKDIYEKVFECREYFIYDPDNDILEGYRRVNEAFEPIQPDEDGRLSCETLGVTLGRWHGPIYNNVYTYVRFFDATGNLLPTLSEAAAQNARAQEKKAQAQAKKAQAETKRAEAEAKKAQDEAKKAEEQRQRAETAEAEVARLRAKLASLGEGKNGGS